EADDVDLLAAPEEVGARGLGVLGGDAQARERRRVDRPVLRLRDDEPAAADLEVQRLEGGPAPPPGYGQPPAAEGAPGVRRGGGGGGGAGARGGGAAAGWGPAGGEVEQEGRFARERAARVDAARREELRRLLEDAALGQRDGQRPRGAHAAPFARRMSAPSLR